MIKGEVTAECMFSETAANGKQHVFVLKQANGRYDNFLACKGYGKTLELAQTVRVGDTVKVSGYLSSRSWDNNGSGPVKWFTDFNVQQLAVLSKASGQHTERDAGDDRDEGDRLGDIDDMGF